MYFINSKYIHMFKNWKILKSKNNCVSVLRFEEVGFPTLKNNTVFSNFKLSTSFLGREKKNDAFWNSYRFF